MHFLFVPSGLATLIVFSFLARSAVADWPHFRGPEQNGSAPSAALPAEWSAQTGKNVAWSAELPGRGPSSPVVVGNRVFVTCSSGPKQDRLHVIAFDASTGNQLWERRFWATGRTSCHPTTANAAPTPTTDGERLFCLFSSCDFVCLDLVGNLLWYRGLALDYPKAGNDTGMSSSPVVVDDVVVVQIECQGDSFIEGIDVLLGSSRWHIERQPIANWASPISMPNPKGEKHIVIAQSPRGVTAINPANGSILWKRDMSCDAITSSSPEGMTVFTPANGVTALALKRSERNDSVEVAWRQSRLRPGAASPVVHDGRIYAVNRSGVLAYADATTGEIKWRLRMKGAFWSTPVAVGQRLYATSDDGVVHVVDLSGDKGKQLAKNTLGEKIQASPAVSDDAIYFRSNKHLWKISQLSQ